MTANPCLPLRSRAPRTAFTLIELLTVIAIIGILAAILIPTVGKVRTAARKVQCVSNQRQLALGVLAYAYDNKGRLPATDRSVVPIVRWMFQVAPYVGRSGGNYSNISNGRITAVFQCPSDPPRVEAFATINDPGNPGDAVSYLHMLPVPLTSRENGSERRNLSQVTDHSRHPMLVDGRKDGGNGVGSAFYKNNEEFASIVKGTTGFMHDDGANVAYYDGSVKYRSNPTWTSVRGFSDLP
jgi:prepilin-type N-terminal cleavage/methylation domain-containing protein/prepilin-type processing-associated H-X9-DG protein